MGPILGPLWVRGTNRNREWSIDLRYPNCSLTGPYIANRVSDKITSLHDHICVCRSGSAADTQAVSDIVRANLYALG